MGQKIVPITHKLSKNHGLVFWMQVPPQIEKQNIAQLRSPPLSFDKFQTTSGMFSHGRIDLGSAALASYMPKVIAGKTADFGAGWGYLSHVALESNVKLTTLDLYEADYNALKAAKQHLNLTTTPFPIHFIGMTLCMSLSQICMTQSFQIHRFTHNKRQISP